MVEIIIKIDGMKCGMCEAHVMDTLRKDFPVKKVSASHHSGLCTMVLLNDVNDEKIYEAFKPTGYKVLSIERRPYVKKCLFSFLKKK